MSIYSLIYLLFAVIMLIYVFKNHLDLLSIAVICFIVYSMYCIWGIGKSGYYRPELSSQLYYLIYMQLIIMFIFSIAYRSAEKNKLRNNSLISKQNENEEILSSKLDTSFYIYTCIIVVFALINIASVGMSTFLLGKSSVWEKSNIFFIISLYGAFPSFAYGLHYNKKGIWIPSLLVELTIFIAGARAFAATLIVIFLCEKGYDLWKNKKSNIIVFVVGGAAIVFLLVYRMVDTIVMSGDIKTVFSVLKTASTWLEALEFNEPRVIIANYDYVLTSGFHLPIGDSIYRILDFVPGLVGLLSLKTKYPEYFSDWLMKEVHGSQGVGGTIWGESYAMFGVAGIIIFMLVWLLFIKKCSKHYSFYKPFSAFLVSIGTYYAWYINRLDFNRVAQVAKITLLCFLMWAAIYLVLGGRIPFTKSIFSLDKSKNK